MYRNYVNFKKYLENFQFLLSKHYFTYIQKVFDKNKCTKYLKHLSSINY